MHAQNGRNHGDGILQGMRTTLQELRGSHTSPQSLGGAGGADAVHAAPLQQGLWRRSLLGLSGDALQRP